MSDTLTALQKALSPKTGMQRIPFPLESYVHPSLPLSAKRLLNYYSEAAPPDARTPAALIPTPGLTTLVTVGTGPIHAINTDFIGWWVRRQRHAFLARAAVHDRLALGGSRRCRFVGGGLGAQFGRAAGHDRGQQ